MVDMPGSNRNHLVDSFSHGGFHFTLHKQGSDIVFRQCKEGVPNLRIKLCTEELCLDIMASGMLSTFPLADIRCVMAKNATENDHAPYNLVRCIMFLGHSESRSYITFSCHRQLYEVLNLVVNYKVDIREPMRNIFG
jgi:hypothetical protein